MLKNYLNPREAYDAERDFWNDFFAPVWRGTYGGMRTDVTETEKEYQLAIELPGFAKDDVKVSLDDGYLTVTAKKEHHNDEKDGQKFVSRERYYGQMSRSWYVGNVDKTQIKANFANGILTVSVPKDEMPEQDHTDYINID